MRHQDQVVQKSVSTNPGLKVNQSVNFPCVKNVSHRALKQGSRYVFKAGCQ